MAKKKRPGADGARKKKGPVTYLTTTEAAALVGCSPDVVDKDVRKGRLEPDAVTGKVKGFFRKTVREWWSRRDVRMGRPPMV